MHRRYPGSPGVSASGVGNLEALLVSWYPGIGAAPVPGAAESWDEFSAIHRAAELQSHCGAHRAAQIQALADRAPGGRPGGQATQLHSPRRASEQVSSHAVSRGALLPLLPLLCLLWPSVLCEFFDLRCPPGVSCSAAAAAVVPGLARRALRPLSGVAQSSWCVRRAAQGTGQS